MHLNTVYMLDNKYIDGEISLQWMKPVLKKYLISNWMKENKIDYNSLLFNDEWYETMERLYNRYGSNVPQEIMDKVYVIINDIYSEKINLVD